MLQQRQVGNSGINVSVLTLGTWPMGGGYFSTPDDAVSTRTIHRAMELGVNCIDTASIYGNGHAEEVLGKALKGRRNEVIIASKCWRTRLAPEAMREELDGSLKRMQTDYVDIYFIHYPDYDQPIAETMGVLEDLKREGKIRAIGVSNFDVPVLEKARQYGTVDVLQPPYSLLWRYIEKEELPYCSRNGIGIFTYSSLAQGLLTGTLGLNTKFAEDDQRPVKSPLFQPANYGRAIEMVGKMRPIAKELGVTVAQLALRWVIDQQGVTTALVGASTPGEIEEDCGALGWEMLGSTKAQLQALSDEFCASLPNYELMFNTNVKQDDAPVREQK